MKKLLILLLLLIIAVPVMAQTDVSTINDESIQIFLQLFPKYKEMIEDIGQNAPLSDTISAVAAKQTELERLCESHGITMRDFAALTAKMTIGFTSMQMETHGLTADPMGLAQIADTTEEEIAVLKKYHAQIAPLLNDNSPE